MATILEYFDDPFRLRDLIDKLGGQTTLDDALDEVSADIESKMAYICPRCQNNGRTAFDIDRCSVCYGKGKTENQVILTTNPSFAPAAPQPTVDGA